MERIGDMVGEGGCGGWEEMEGKGKAVRVSEQMPLFLILDLSTLTFIS